MTFSSKIYFTPGIMFHVQSTVRAMTAMVCSWRWHSWIVEKLQNMN